MEFLVPLLLLTTRILLAVAAPANASVPTVRLDGAIFQGVSDGSSNRFLGIPFAQSPIGDLRFRLPLPNTPYNGKLNATIFGPACPQQLTNITIPDSLPQNVSALFRDFLGKLFEPIPGSEDCLTVNVWTPVGVNSSRGLPVVVWIPGGGFEIGGASTTDGGVIVQRSVQLGEPIVFVSLNYRLNAFGFLASKEVKDADLGNLGLRDQRQALRWVQTYIRAFGGDPEKVTLWGISAGAISIALQLLAYGGNSEGLFHGAIMESGSPTPSGDIIGGQKYYDALVEQTGCSDAVDTLHCLREVPFEQLMDAVNSSPSIMSYQSVVSAWTPRSDGTLFSENFIQALLNGKFAEVPLITGDVDDEGTIFAAASLNVTTDNNFRSYVSTIFFPNISQSNINVLADLYPDNPTLGSPFDTGLQGAYTPQYKRVSAFIGDLVFQGPRRLLCQLHSDKQNVWGYLFRRGKDGPFGTPHGADGQVAFGPGDLTDYIINFINHLDPNGAISNTSEISWPTYTNETSQLLTFVDGPTPLVISKDTFRQGPINFVLGLIMPTPLGGV